jgi:hypothetical protein
VLQVRVVDPPAVAQGAARVEHGGLRGHRRTDKLDELALEVEHGGHLQLELGRVLPEVGRAKARVQIYADELHPLWSVIPLDAGELGRVPVRDRTVHRHEQDYRGLRSLHRNGDRRSVDVIARPLQRSGLLTREQASKGERADHPPFERTKEQRGSSFQ